MRFQRFLPRNSVQPSGSRDCCLHADSIRESAPRKASAMIRSRRCHLRAGLAAAALIAGLGAGSPAFADNVPDVIPAKAALDIPAIQESKPGWSWAAVGQMVMDFYSVPPL